MYGFQNEDFLKTLNGAVFESVRLIGLRIR